MNTRFCRSESSACALRTALPLTQALSPLRGEGGAPGALHESGAIRRVVAQCLRVGEGYPARELALEYREASVAPPSPLNGERAGVRGESGQRRPSFKRLLSCFAFAFILVSCVFVARAAEDLSATLQRGLFEEEANNNLPAAIKAYEAVVTAVDAQRKLAG